MSLLRSGLPDVTEAVALNQKHCDAQKGTVRKSYQVVGHFCAVVLLLDSIDPTRPGLKVL